LSLNKFLICVWWEKRYRGGILSQPAILVFMRKAKTVNYLWGKFRELPYQKIVEIQNIDDVHFNLKRVFHEKWSSTETLFLLSSLLFGIAIYYQEWLASILICIFFALYNLLLIPIEHYRKNRDPFVAQYKNLIMRGETLLIVTCESNNFEKFIKVIQKVQDEPIAFFAFMDDQTPVKVTSSREMLPQVPETKEEVEKQAKGLSAMVWETSYQKQYSQDFLAHLNELSETYQKTYKLLHNYALYNENIQLSAEWLLDNAYTVKQSINDVQKNLPENYFRELPFITSGPYKGSPALYPLVSRIVAASDGKISAENIKFFLNTYQEKTPLKIGELWAFPLILKIRLIECLVSLTTKILNRVQENQSADFWANRILNASRIDSEKLYSVLSILSKEIPYPSTYFADQMMIQLTDTEAANTVIVGWLQRKVGGNLHDIIQVEQAKQTLEQTSIANVISSLRSLEQMNWREVFEEVSIVDKILSKDPAHKYTQMDFPTKDRYRRTVEVLAKLTHISEEAIADTTVALAESHSGSPLTSHVGYYLIDEGKPALEQAIGYQLPTLQSLLKKLKPYLPSIYISGCVFLSLLLTASFWYIFDYHSVAIGIILLLLSLIPFSEFVIQIVNYTIVHLVRPNILPKMDYKEGLPDQYRTLVVVPTLFYSEKAVQKELEKLEIHFLANTDPQIAFGILSDFSDYCEEGHHEDHLLLKTAKDGIQYLNTKYQGQRFYLFHRSRKFNPSENAWIGWERKRGKLENLNSFLMGSESTELDNFLQEGEPAFLAGVSYVLTADSDTQLPKNSVQRLVETLSHPLNVGYIDPLTKKLLRGYSIVQPRVSTNYISSNATWFSRLFSDPSGIDPYTKSTSDVYQDLFDEGVYHGKGLYDYKLFHHILSERFPENTILSHDLLEGSYVRSAFASDIEFYDSFPETYFQYAKRQHRWVRGDWQLLSWLGPTVPTSKNTREKNPLSPINRWKIFDNLRRSLLPITATAALLLSWFSSAFIPWTILIFLLFALPIFLRVMDLSWMTSIAKLHGILNELFKGCIKTIVTFSLLPNQAWVNASAIATALFRKHCSRKNLLQWSVSSSSSHQDRSACNRQLAILSLSSLAGILFLSANSGLSIAIPILVLWAFSPVIAALLNHPYLTKEISALTPYSENYLRMLARKTWRYFDDFVTEETHYLPPDNYQEKLKVEIAYRTSPTNIGLYMMSSISAYRFGYATALSLIERLKNTTDTLKKLEQYEGHFLNWYDIKNIAPLLPKYVSTVDSGNLLASIWSVEKKCQALLDDPILDAERIIAAVHDQLNILMDSLHRENAHSLTFNFNYLSSLVHAIRQSPAELKNDLEQLQTELLRFLASLENTSFPQEAYYWLQQLEKLVSQFLNSYETLMPWLKLFVRPEAEEIAILHPEGIEWKQIAIKQFPTFRELLNRNVPGLIPFIGWLQTLSPEKLNPVMSEWTQNFLDETNRCFAFVEKFKEGIDFLIKELEDISSGMNMSFLYNKERKLFSIGYNVSDHRLDSSCYDLLASEARLASFIAIAKGDVPLEHWWCLGRPTTEAFGMIVLQSWGGTMFEYLMPVIWSKNFNDTLLDYACKTAVECQIAYGNQLGIPWGISESAYSRLDIHNIYQYRAFGVPYLGLKTGLENDFVITPYSSALALMIDPAASFKNLKRLDNKELMSGPYGFFEAIDYSREYTPEGRHGIVIHAYMAHHLGMTITSFCNTLFNGYLQNFFHAHPRVQALESILYERLDIKESKVPGRTKEQVFPKLSATATFASQTHFESPLTPLPISHLLSNGNYSIMVTNSGGGYSKFQNIDITRWRVDSTCDNWGTCFYIRDVERNAFFSAASFPTANLGADYSINFSNHKVDITKKDLALEVSTEIVVSPEDNVEIRCLSLTNQTMRNRDLEVTSYVEIALAEHKADLVHPVFSKMFIETEAVPECQGLIAHRRKRDPNDPERWCFHITAGDLSVMDGFYYETDRALFFGANHTLANPEEISTDLSNTHGYVLDPIFAIRKKIRLASGNKSKIAFITGYAHSRDEALKLLNKYKNIDASKRVMDMAWTHAELDLRRLHISHDEAHLFQLLATLMIYPDVHLRASADILKSNRFGQEKLWGHGISGDNPILIVTIEDIYNIEVVHSALLAHAFWSLRGLKADIVIVNKEATSYEQPLNEHLVRLIQAYSQYTGINTNGGIFLLVGDKLPKEELNLIYTAAHAVLIAERGSLSQQLAMPRRTTPLLPLLAVNPEIPEQPSPPLPFLELLFFNGIGGFTQDGKEYAIFYGHDKNNPAPWINVIANSRFGFLATARGLGMTWNSNSQMNRLSPWSNDPTLNPITDICYIRDDQSGKFWSIASSPILENDPYRARHGNGYTVFEHNSHAIEQELTVFTPLDEQHTPVRIQILRLTNRSSTNRKLSVFSYVELTMDQDREEAQRYIETSWNYEINSLMAVNYYRPPAFAGNTTFISSSPDPASYTASRKDFIGRNQTTKLPDALKRTKLSQRTGVAMDPCFALQTIVELYPNESAQIITVLGESGSTEQIKAICNYYKDGNNARNALEKTKNWWDKFHSKFQLQSPDKTLDLMFNRWLSYQNLSCRMWARSAFYQSGGAYGFRDQLQDSSALVYLDPSITKEQILKAASRQFVEGDVQHWWHPETGSGVRTRISDDLLWLPYVAVHYVNTTHDDSIMDIEIPYIEGRQLAADEHDAIIVPTQSKTTGTLKEHCLKAIEKALAFGPHGLPLIGGGDWNDGMDRVGAKGKGESVWLAWFMVYVMDTFAAWLKSKQELKTAEYLAQQAQNILKAIEKTSWDGEWYLRAFSDNGNPIGSHLNSEDKIDSIPQSWAVISGQDDKRIQMAMESVEKYLIDEVHRLILLFTPPFDKTSESPGYIQGYPPGVRENGGQYTHAAAWLAMAYAKRGEGDKAMHVLRMINPINRALNQTEIDLYRVEPYVLAADIYALPGQEGRGGWTWYTGSAGMTYRAILEDVLGFKLNGEVLEINPCVPKEWDAFTLVYRHGEGSYEVRVENPQHVSKGIVDVEMDGQKLADRKIPLNRSSGNHHVKVTMGLSKVL
jgi:cyclic beta-1,2-glucan synthetase